MSSREIAELTGKNHQHVRRDTKKMLAELGVDDVGYVQVWTDPQNGQKYEEYALPQNLTYTLVSGYRTDLRLKIINRWMELERGTAATTQILALPRKRKPAFDVAFRRCMNIVALLPNVDENQRVMMAARGTFELTGVNPVSLMGYASLPAPDQTNYLTPTEIGREFGLSGQAVNQILAQAGLQRKGDSSAVRSDWTMTAKGLGYGRMFDTTRQRGKGSQQQLKWKPEVALFVRPFARTPEAVS